MSWATIDVVALYVLQFLTLYRVLTRENREPASRVAWMLVVLGLPGLGIVLYFLLGEVNFGSRAVAEMKDIIHELPAVGQVSGPPAAELAAAEPIPPVAQAAFERAAAVNHFRITRGNLAEITPGPDEAIDRMVADFDAAKDHIHIVFYIWLDDHNGRKVMAALERAVARGVTCRCLVDGLGSRLILRSADWKRMVSKGVRVGVAFSTHWPALRMLLGRIDIRDHRKIVVIDGQITYCGSQNCADPAFLIKKKFAPWVDILMRADGPVAWQQQQLFVTGWMSHTGQDIRSVLAQPTVAHKGGFPAIGFGSGPEISLNAVPDVYNLCLAAAQEEVVITTPYFVPSVAVIEALRSTALRGVKVTLILPRHNDSRFVAWASRSFYRTLMVAGVRIFEFRHGLLHAKTLTVDGNLTLIGSANLDRRSFELNFENNILLTDHGLTAEVYERQMFYLTKSHEVPLERVESWSSRRRLLYNLAATIGPVL